MRLASIVLLCCVPGWAVSSKERACTGGVEAARIRVDVRRPSSLEIRSLAHVKTIEANSKIIYTPADLPDDLKKNAKVALALVPVEGGNDAALSILEYKPAASVAEWFNSNGSNHLQAQIEIVVPTTIPDNANCKPRATTSLKTTDHYAPSEIRTTSTCILPSMTRQQTAPAA